MEEVRKKRSPEKSQGVCGGCRGRLGQEISGWLLGGWVPGELGGWSSHEDFECINESCGP